MSGTHDDDPFAHLARHHHDEPRPSPVRIGIGGPVGSGKTALVAALCRTLGDELSLAVVTNDIYTTEDADFLRRGAVLPDERIAAVRTGCCPHTAIRDDITANLDAIEDLVARVPGVQLVLVESGGDNLTASFSAGLVDAQVAVAMVRYDRLERAVIDDREQGFLKLVTDRRRDVLLGAHAAGESAVEVIQAVTTAMAAGTDITTLAGVEFAYPTYSAIIGEAARQLLAPVP